MIELSCVFYGDCVGQVGGGSLWQLVAGAVGLALLFADDLSR